MQNHSNRPELIAAAREGIGKMTRRSPTLGIDMSYLAVPFTIAGENVALVRVAMEVESINRQLVSILGLFWFFALCVGLVAVGLTYATVGRILWPLTQLTRDAQAIAAGKERDLARVGGRDEIGLLAGALNQMQLGQANQRRQLRESNERMSTVLSSMDEGIVAVDADEEILLVNEASRKLLGIATDDGTATSVSE